VYLIFAASASLAPATSTIKYINDSLITFELPESQYGGFDVAILIGTAYDAQQSEDTIKLLSYYGPVLDVNGALEPWCNGTRVTSYLLDSVNGGQQICLNGRDFGTDISLMRVTYGNKNGGVIMHLFPEIPSTLTISFECKVVELTLTRLKCNISEGGGYGLSFVLTYNNVISQRSNDVIHYPPPVIIDATIRSSIDSIEGTLLQNSGKS
jgi:hypothetical protein